MVLTADRSFLVYVPKLVLGGLLPYLAPSRRDWAHHQAIARATIQTEADSVLYALSIEAYEPPTRERSAQPSSTHLRDYRDDRTAQLCQQSYQGPAPLSPHGLGCWGDATKPLKGQSTGVTNIHLALR